MSALTYLATFPTGFQDQVRFLLEKKLKDSVIILVGDGIIVFSGKFDLNYLRQLKFINNLYLIQKYFPQEETENLSLAAMVEICYQTTVNIPQEFIGDKKTFQIIASQANQYTSMDKQLKKSFEKKIESQLGIIADRSLPQLEFIILKRTEGYGFYLFRLTYHPDNTKRLNKGELKPDLAQLMIESLQPCKNDLIIDPFAGSGTIPINLAARFPYGKIVVNDSNQELTNSLITKTKKFKSFTVSSEDVFAFLDSFKVGEVDRIITDPPWGFYEEMSDQKLIAFYEKMLDKFAQILNESGRMVLLIGRRKLFEKILEQNQKLELISKVNTLVNGKKAGVYLIEKHGL